MGTSKSNEQLGECIGGALIFSGRPNPTWDVDQDVLERLQEGWNSLETCLTSDLSAPPLGYRGCFLRCGTDLEWTAYGGIVVMKTSTEKEAREDKDRNFERLLLSSAPEKILPDSLSI